MPAFAYKAKLITGNVTEGTIQAPDQKSAIDQLRSQKLTPLEISEASKSLGEISEASQDCGRAIRIILQRIYPWHGQRRV